jgi:hypothetical protein
MLPVTSLNSVRIGTGQVGPIFKKVLSQWSENVGVNIEQQIKSWMVDTKLDQTTPYQFRAKDNNLKK